MTSHEPLRGDGAKQDHHNGAGDGPDLQGLPEIVRDFKLETNSVDDYTVHVIHGIHGPRQQVWKWERDLGRGGSGFVRLQSCVDDNGRGHPPGESPTLRAVKCLQLKDSSGFIHYSRELETLIKFSHLKVFI